MTTFEDYLKSKSDEAVQKRIDQLGKSIREAVWTFYGARAIPPFPHRAFGSDTEIASVLNQLLKKSEEEQVWPPELWEQEQKRIAQSILNLSDASAVRSTAETS